MYYVYALIDPRNNLPFYIGKGMKKNSRHLDHFCETNESTSNRHKTFKINHLRSLGFEIPVSIVFDNITLEDDAYTLESCLIRQYGRENIDKGGILTNICIDSRPPNQYGKKQSSTHIKRRVESYKLTCAEKGRKPHSLESRRKMGRSGSSNSFYGKHHTDEVKRAHSTRMKGNRNNSKKYIFTDPDGTNYVVVGEFYKFCNDHGLTISTMEKVLKNNKSPISGKCKGWKVKKETVEEPNNES